MLIVRAIEGFKSRWRNAYYQMLGVKLHGYCWMRQIEIPRNFSEIEIESSCAFDRGVVLLCSGQAGLRPKISIGSGTYVNRNSFIDASLSVKIGRQCAIGPDCYITDHDHSHEPGLAPLAQPLISKPTCIGDQVWLGAKVVVLKGVTIGDEVVVGAGSVVTKDIPAGAVAVGNPARVIKHKTAMPTFNGAKL
jgi:acetyltransferase-like isoleucine patch superfamily enzyme